MISSVFVRFLVLYKRARFLTNIAHDFDILLRHVTHSANATPQRSSMHIFNTVMRLLYMFSMHSSLNDE